MTHQQISEAIRPEAVRDEKPERKNCHVGKALSSCMSIIFGASGDLTSRKLFPALYSLYANDRFPDKFVIVGCARSEMSDEDFRSRMKESLKGKDTFDDKIWEQMAPLHFYQSIGYGRQESYESLAGTLDRLDREHETGGNILFYLVVPPAACILTI